MWKNNWGKILLTLLTGNILGCTSLSDIKTRGLGPLPIYDEPKPLVFSKDEEDILKKFSTENTELFRKIQNQSHAYRIIVRLHNENATRINYERLKALGYTEKDLKSLGYIKNEQHKPTDGK